MSKTLAEMLAAAKGGPIDFYGKSVAMSHRIRVSKGQEVEVEFLRVAENLRQGFEVSIDQRKGHIDINGETLKAPVFWLETAPKVFRFQCQPQKGHGIMNVWNVWRNPAHEDNIDSWIGNSGLYVEAEGDNSWIFHCSSGIGPPDFDELVFKMTMR